VQVELRDVRVTVFSFLWHCLRYYIKAKKMDLGMTYFTIASHGVPQVTVMIAHGRNAWELSTFAAEFFASRDVAIPPEASDNSV
jgi:hypothetical protein